MIDTVRVTRYVTPLREGGSLPGIIEGDDLGTYVCKFRGAGQGVRVLVAEVIVSGLASRLGLRTPRLVALDRTNTEHAPWHVIPADRKWFRNLAIGRLLHAAFTDLDPQWPVADFDVEEQRTRLLDEASVS